MNLFKPKVIIPIAIFFGVFATYAAHLYLEKQKERIKKSAIRPQRVAVATSDLSMGTKLSQQNLKMVEWPENIIPAGSFSDTSRLLDRTLKTDILKDEAILESKLAAEGSAGGFISQIPAGMRAVTVSVNVVSGVAGFILPGMRVDLVITLGLTDDIKETTTKIILENVIVLAIDQTFKPKNEEPKIVGLVTLLVTPEEAERAILAHEKGKLQLILRNSTDQEMTFTSGVSLGEIFGKKITAPPQVIYRTVAPRREVKPERPATPVQVERPKPKTVEVFRSNVRSEVNFDDKGGGKK